VKIKIDHGLSLFIMEREHRNATKSQLALALAQGVSVTRWARDQNVARPTNYTWAKGTKIRAVVEVFGEGQRAEDGGRIMNIEI
jgi:hypothetical protein